MIWVDVGLVLDQSTLKYKTVTFILVALLTQREGEKNLRNNQYLAPPPQI